MNGRIKLQSTTIGASGNNLIDISDFMGACLGIEINKLSKAEFIKIHNRDS